MRQLPVRSEIFSWPVHYAAQCLSLSFVGVQ